MADNQSKKPDPPVRVMGSERTIFRDIYHRFLRARWHVALLFIICSVLLLNVLFAVGYLATGGVHNMRPGSFRDAFFFSVQTLGTIGYGAMYPTSDAANLLVTAEAILGLLVTALATGLVFAKFTVSIARIGFSECATIAPMNGVPTFMFRIGNQRGNTIVEALVRVVMIRTEKPLEGGVFYRMLDLPLTRERSPALSRSWTALHPITAASPLFGMTPETFAEQEIEFMVTMLGVDDTSLQQVHASHRYSMEQVKWGMRPADILSEEEGGVYVVDLGKFHHLVVADASHDFPYSNNLRVDPAPLGTTRPT